MSERDDVPEFIEALTRIATEHLVDRLGLPRESAAEVARRIANRVCAEYARRTIYVPVDYDPRNRDIYDRYHRQGRAARPCTPDRIRELAADYSLTERRIYEIIRDMREADQAARQGVLPGLEQEPADA